MARGLLGQAQSSLESAREATKDGHWAYAVRTSQDASELALKALLLSAGTDPPKTHDLSVALRYNQERLRSLGLEPREIDEMARTAGNLAEDRSKSLYGDEKQDVPAARIYDRGDAEGALRAAENVCDRCRGVVENKL